MYILYNCSAISPALPRQDACIDCLAWISVPWQQASPTERQCKCQNKMQCWSALTLDDVENAGQHLIHSFCAGQRFTVAIAIFFPSVRRWWSYVLLTSDSSLHFYFPFSSSSFHCLAFGRAGSEGIALLWIVFGFAFGVC